MHNRLWFVVALGALPLIGCGGDRPGSAAAKVTLQWQEFRPGCVSLTAASGDKEAEPTLLSLDKDARSGSRTVAVYRGEGWGADISLTARAFEGPCDEASPKQVAEAAQTVSLSTGVAEVTLALAAPDLDDDGFVDAQAELPGSDCDDDPTSGKAVHPGAEETCNGVDDDCDGTVDVGLGDTFFADADLDGFGDPAAQLLACAQPTGYVVDDTDCLDSNAEIHPGATETCNDLDDDCDGNVDQGLSTSTWFVDGDLDGFGLNGQTVDKCNQPPGHAAQGGDCDDTDGENFPGNAETCDTKDNDCDTQIDEGVQITWYRDADMDTFGDAQDTLLACATAPAGYVADDTDCDDALGDVNPGAAETCNMRDDDCDMATDEGVLNTYFVDADLDTYGDPMATGQACAPGMGLVTNGDDCDDSLAGVNPGETEVCNGRDDNCAGGIDEGVTMTFFMDVDGDGEGDVNAPVQACTAGNGVSSSSTDCDDGNPWRSTTLAEVCDGLDNDCAGGVDDGPTCTGFSFKTPGNAGGGGHDWRKVAPFAPGKIYAVGHDQNNGKTKIGSWDGLTRVNQWDDQCENTGFSGWADPATETLYVGGVGRFERLAAAAADCDPPVSAGGAGIRDVVGVDLGGVTVVGASSAGQLWYWTVSGSMAQTLGPDTDNIFYALSGDGLTDLVAVGSDNAGTPRPVIWENRGSLTFQTAALPTLPSGSLVLNDVSMSAQGFVVAVGDQNTVLTRTRTGSWQVLTGPSGGLTLMTVKAFGPSLIYVVGNTASSTELWRYAEDGTGTLGWSIVPGHNIPAASEPQDLDGTAPNDLWVVGDDGLMRHWSQ